MKLFFNCLLKVFFKGWFDYVEGDMVFGNGFQIAGYGLRLIGIYILFFLGRVLIVLLWPIFTVLMYRSELGKAERMARAERAADADL